MTIISGVNCENTQESIEMAREAKEAEADGILLMPLHIWLRFGMNPNAPFEFIKDVAEGADIDIIIHLYPATSKAFYPVESLIKMCKEIPHVKCIKVGTRVTAIYEYDVHELRKHCPDVSLITCHDETLCQISQRGAYPHEYTESFQSGNNLNPKLGNEAKRRGELKKKPVIRSFRKT